MFPRVYKTEGKRGAASALGTSSTGARVPRVLERLRRGGLQEWVEGHG